MQAFSFRGWIRDIFGNAPATAAIRYDIEGVFDEHATLSGSFVFDGAEISDLSVATQTGEQAETVYNSAWSYDIDDDYGSVRLTLGDGDRRLVLDLSDIIGQSPVRIHDCSYEQAGNGRRRVVRGSITLAENARTDRKQAGARVPPAWSSAELAG